MKTNSIRFEVSGKEVIVHGCPELEGCVGYLGSEGIASFNTDRHDWYLANILTGSYRKFTSYGRVVADDSEIDYDAISKSCPNGLYNAQKKCIRYEDVRLYSDFKDGINAISWMLYPDGIYFADSDGFGMEDNNEEKVYAIIDSELNIIEPFRPIQNIEKHLAKLRKEKKAAQTKAESNNEARTRIFNLIITDESGSMYSIKKEAIDSVNETLQTIAAAQRKHPDQEHFVTMVSFNNRVNTICECVPVNDVKELDENSYCPGCSTALYDAMGMSLSALRPKVQEGDKVLVTVVTDGYENASTEYNGAAIKALVDELKAKGWVFAYIGANQDVEAVAATIAITNVMQFTTTSKGTKEMSRRVSSARERLFDNIADCCFNAVEANENFFNED